MASQGNVFVHEDGSAKIGDFGISGIYDENGTSMETTAERGSTRWMAPELLDPPRCGFSKFQRTPQSDAYSFGCVILEVAHPARRVRRPLTTSIVQVLTLKSPYPDVVHSATVLYRVFEKQVPYVQTEDVPDEYWEVAEQCWSTAPLRPAIGTIVPCLSVRSSALLSGRGVCPSVPNRRYPC